MWKEVAIWQLTLFIIFTFGVVITSCLPQNDIVVMVRFFCSVWAGAFMSWTFLLPYTSWRKSLRELIRIDVQYLFYEHDIGQIENIEFVHKHVCVKTYSNKKYILPLQKGWNKWILDSVSLKEIK